MEIGVSYFGNRWPRHAAADLRDIRAKGGSWVVHTFDEADLLHNRGNLAALAALSKGLGLKVYFSPWALGGVFGGEAVSGFVARHPEAAQRLNTGEATANACLVHPRFRAFMRGWIAAAVECGADAILWDEPHLWRAAWEGKPERPGHFSMGAPGAWEAWRRSRRAAASPPPKTRTAEVEAFRDWMVLDFLRWATREARRLRPGLLNAVCMPADDGPWPNHLWERVAALPMVDIFSTDPYWKSAPTQGGPRRAVEGFVDVQASRLVEICRRHGKRSMLWLQCFALERRDQADLFRALRLLAAARPDALGVWGYRGTAAYSSIACEGADALWERLGRTLKGLSGTRRGSARKRG